MSKIDYIVLDLESVESYQVPSNAIKKFSIKGMKIDTQLNNHHGVSIKFPEPTFCEELILDLKVNAINDISTMQNEDNGDPMMLPHRLTAYQDIVAVSCVMENDTNFNVYLPYNADINENNLWMKSKILTDNDGDKIVHIVVRKQD